MPKGMYARHHPHASKIAAQEHLEDGGVIAGYAHIIQLCTIYHQE